MWRIKRKLLLLVPTLAIILALSISGVASAEDNGVIKIIMQPAGETGWTNLASLIGILEANLNSFIGIAHDNISAALGEDVNK